jgi:hypothetical protein
MFFSHKENMSQNLIFLHLPKNGGNTLHLILERFYPKRNTFTIRVIDNTRLNVDEFIALPEEKRDQIRLLKGHMNFGLHEYLEGESKYITFLRKPQDRVVSYYRYVIRRPQHRLYKEVKGGNMSLYDFVTKVDQPDVHNAQIRFISGIRDREELMLEKALENIDKHFAFVGQTERYHESLVMMKRIFNWETPFYILKNKSRNKIPALNVKERTLETINELNNGDNLLYEEMSKRLDTLIPDNDLKFDLDMFKLNAFRNIFSSPIALKLFYTAIDTGLGQKFKSRIFK